MTGTTRRVYKWPGVNIRITEGPDHLESDTVYYEKLFVSSFERACLENLTVSRMINGEKRNVDQEIVERRILDILNTRGEEAINQFRDKARTVAQTLGMQEQFERLNQIIGSLLSTRPSNILKSPIAAAHVMGEPYDSGRMELLNNLAAELRSGTFANYPEKTITKDMFSNFAFYESYFSNYIEGTTFLVDEALDIIYNDAMIPLRSGDTHDIKGTFKICADRKQIQVIPKTGEELIDLLRQRHATLMAGRPDKNPGAFKLQPNRFGNSVFVEPRFVTGTLKMGFLTYQSLQDPIARALFMMFMISEIHPFEDGNGRMARIMMNAEFVNSGVTKIIIPTVFCEDYILALRRTSRNQEPSVYVNMMNRAHAFSHWLDPVSLDKLRLQFEQSNAFKEPGEDAAVLKWAEVN